MAKDCTLAGSVIDVAAAAFASRDVATEALGDRLRLKTFCAGGADVYLAFEDPVREVSSPAEVMTVARLRVEGSADDEARRRLKHRVAIVIHELGLMPPGVVPCPSWKDVVLP